MHGLLHRVADIFATEHEYGELFIYAAILSPLLAWTIYTLLGAIKPRKAGQSSKNRKVALPSPEQTALLIQTRRSIFLKDMSGAPVDRKIVEAMLEAANWAPTHGKTEPWRFNVLGQPALQEFISVMIKEVEELDLPKKEEKIAKLESKRKKMAPVRFMITIGYKRRAGQKLMPEWEELAATAAAVQNMHLTATAFGAGGYWTSWGPEEARDSRRVKTWLGLEAEDKCIGAFLLGSSNRIAGYRQTRGPIAEKVTWRV